MSTSSKFNWGDWLERSLWTALQSGLAVFTLGDLSTGRSALVAGGAALLSAVKSLAKERLAK
tara:strand:- start:5226 stop:5411 length:186 start_codon:yes stop_codon:yes gene_type:complete